MLFRHASLRRGGTGRRAGAFAQAGEVFLALEHERVSLLVRQHVLAEGGAERGQPLADCRNSALRIGRQPRAGAAEGHVVALQNPRLFGREAKRIAPVPPPLEPAVKALMNGDAVSVTADA